MLISVLLPTRDRLSLLKLAIESVRAQGYDDYEIVISDNCSPPEVQDYVKSLGDARIVYYRYDEPVSVTENWNNALRRSTGEYMIMLGDDDALCEGFFHSILALVNDWESPDCIYSGAYMFTYRGVVPGADYGTVHENKNAIFWRDDYGPYWLSADDRLSLANDAMALYSSYGFNMQFVTVSRKIVNLLSDEEGFYKTQYPDYYAMNNLMLRSERFLVAERPLVCIGASPSSFGWYYQNRKESSGNKVLHIEAGMEQAANAMQSSLLPGTSMNTNWLTSMLKLYEDNRNVGGLNSPDIEHYRRKQVLYMVLLRANDAADESQLTELEAELRFRERCLYGVLLPLTGLGGVGRKVLSFLHTASQKRARYMARALWTRLRGLAPVTYFHTDTNILQSEELLKRGR